MKCKICNYEMVEYGQGTYYLEDGKLFSVPFYYCKSCNAFIRQIDEVSIYSHLTSASHTAIKNEEKLYKGRINFFKYIYSITQKHSNDNITFWLDFGCSYGHFIEFLKQKNINSEGVEISEQVRKYAQDKGLLVFESVDTIFANKKYDVISLIDSLYYCDEPIILIQKLFSITKENGLLVLRITNRNWLAKFRKIVLKKEINLALGDATISYSKKSITLLLENNGYKIIKMRSWEKGKVLPIKTKLFYILTTILNIVSIGLINLSPGLIITARKKQIDRQLFKS